MKKCSSLVWQFFDRIEENGRCVAIQCKLCDNEYKYFGNTTNLRVHLHNKHPIQWDLAQDGSMNSSFRTTEDDNTASPAPKRKKYGTRGYKDKNVRYSVIVDSETENDNAGGSTPMHKIEIQRVDVLDSEADHDRNDDEDTMNFVRQMHNHSDVEWLEDDMYQTITADTYEPKHSRMKYKKIKREITTPPPRRASQYLSKTPLKPERAERIIIENTKDEYSVFGEYVANKLRKFKTPRTCGNLQQLITTILWQAEYGMYDNVDSVKRVLLGAVQDPEPTLVVHEVPVVEEEIRQESHQSTESDSINLE